MRRPPRKRKGQGSGSRRLNGAVLDVAAAELLGATEKVIRARAARGLLPWRRWGGRILFLREEMLAFVAALPGVTLQQALQNIRAREVAARYGVHESTIRRDVAVGKLRVKRNRGTIRIAEDAIEAYERLTAAAPTKL